MDTGSTGRDGRHYTLSIEAQAFIVGAVAFLLPIILIAGWWIAGACFYNSISHFYYAPFFGDVFVACLIIIGTFLIVYRSDKQEHVFETYGANAAGVCAYLVALLPTEGRGCEAANTRMRPLLDITAPNRDTKINIADFERNEPFTLFSNVGVLHLLAAGLLLAFLAYYAIVVFTRPDPGRPPDQPEGPEKRSRNKRYRLSGYIIIACIAVLILKLGVSRVSVSFQIWWNSWNLTFWFEAIALWAFGYSWAVKARFFGMRDPGDPKPPVPSPFA